MSPDIAHALELSKQQQLPTPAASSQPGEGRAEGMHVYILKELLRYPYMADIESFSTSNNQF